MRVHVIKTNKSQLVKGNKTKRNRRARFAVQRNRQSPFFRLVLTLHHVCLAIQSFDGALHYNLATFRLDVSLHHYCKIPPCDSSVYPALDGGLHSKACICKPQSRLDVSLRAIWDFSLQVKTKNGIIQGRQYKSDNDVFFSYQGIPFAEPPVGNLRFRDPQTKVGWKGILDASKEASSCIVVSLRPASLFKVEGSEDCLYLNVFTPVRPKGTKSFVPVIFWIYGGAFVTGSSDINTYRPDFLLKRQLIVVTFNYRLGAFGFLSTQDMACPGNYGLKDQNMALKWVRDNIQNFGGDPNLITISGQSAGSSCVIYHMLSPMSRGLFQRAIAMSGDSLSQWSFQKNPRIVAFDLGLHLGIRTQNSSVLISELRKIDVGVIKNGYLLPILLHLAQVYQEGLPFTPVIEPKYENAFISELSYNILERGDFARVPLIIGATNMEINVFSSILRLVLPILQLLFDVSPSSLPSRMNIPSFSDRRKVGQEITRHYVKSNSFTTSTAEEAAHYLSDQQFIVPIEKTAKLFSRYIPVYFYIFTYQNSRVQKIIENLFGTKGEYLAKGAAHAEDLIYIWKTPGWEDFNVFVDNPGPFSEVEILLCRRATKFWSNFARFGKPTPVVDPTFFNITWPAILDSENFNYLEIGENLKVLQNYRGEHVQFWEKLYKKYAKPPFYTY